MSKTVLDRKNPNVPYVFISYSHVDSEAVGNLLTALNDCGADFWYDKELHFGQNWYKKVEEVTANKNCVGIMYVVSADFIFSQACYDEFRLLDKLRSTHENFHDCYIIVDDKKPENFNAFIKSVRLKLMNGDYPNEEELLERTAEFKKKFDQQILYEMTAKDGMCDDNLVRTVFADAFAKWGCASEENTKIDTLVDDWLVDGDYRVKTDCSVITGEVNCSEIEWKVFSYSGSTLSAIPVADELYATTCRSLAQNVMSEINKHVNILKNDNADEKSKQAKHIEFEPEFLECLNRDAEGNVIRFLRANEHEKNYLQLKEALEKVPTADAADDGYFFVVDNRDNVLFADRESNDVYRHIHVDAYASVFPVIDIDLNKYKAYLAKKR